MRRTGNAFAASVLTSAASAQTPAPPAPPPPPDIYLAQLDLTRATPTVGAPLNFTDRAGYDNQPSFSSDGTSIFFTSVRDRAQADIYRYVIAGNRTVRVTTTAPESEYSATPIDGGSAISVVRVERDSAQRLWRFPLIRPKGVGVASVADLRTSGVYAVTRIAVRPQGNRDRVRGRGNAVVRDDRDHYA